MKKIGVCVVLYNPYKDIVPKLKNYIKYFKNVVAVDNSDQGKSIYESIREIPGLTYISMDGNKGIAAALNKGLYYFANLGFDIVLTMDQDSIFPFAESEKIITIVDNNYDKYSILCLNFNEHKEYKSDDLIEVKNWLTSGNFVKISSFLSVKGFNEKLFIDYVDFDFDYRIRRSGGRVVCLKDYSLVHTIGTPITFHLFGQDFHAMNHSAIRYYYRYRNAYYLMKKYEDEYILLFLKEIFIQLPKMIIYEKDRKSKLSMIWKGIKDGRSGRLGKLGLKILN